MEMTMSFEIIAFFTLSAMLFAAGFASGPVIMRKFGPSPHRHHGH